MIFNAKIFKMKERLLSFLEFIEEKNAVFEKKAGLSNGFVNNIGDNVRKNTIKKFKQHTLNLIQIGGRLESET